MIIRKNVFYVGVTFILFFFNSCNIKEDNVIIGEWSTHSIILKGKDLLNEEGRFSRMAKPTFFNKNGEVIFFLDNYYKEKIVGKFKIVKSEQEEDLIKIFDCQMPEINDVYDVNVLTNDPKNRGKIEIVLESANNVISIERIYMKRPDLY